MIRATGIVIFGTAADIRIIRAVSVVGWLGAALPIGIRVCAGTADRYGLLRVGRTLLAARATDTTAVRDTELRFVAAGTVAYRNLASGATDTGWRIAVVAAVLGRGITAGLVTLDL